MRRTTLLCLALLLPAAPAAPQSKAPAASSQPPHAWLFGTWTGGMFPVPSGTSIQACLSQPVVIFTRDLVLRATLTEQTLTQREIQSARAVPGGEEFRFNGPALNNQAAPDSNLLGLGGNGSLAGFGCETPDILHVQRRGENEIAFPGCADFPNPLIRCR